MEALHPNYGLTKSTEEGLVDEQFVNPLPRAVLRSNQFILLDGEWQFAIDKEDKGLQEAWYLGHQYNETAHWPGSIEEHMLHGGVQSHWQDKVVAWYEREFPMPELNTDNGGANSLIQLTFGACGYETMVWLNGILLKTIEGEEVHVGEYTSFSYELNQEILKSRNRITVRIADTMDANIPRGK